MAQIQIMSVRTLLTLEFPPGESMLGRNLLDKSGALLISGPQKVGKSLFATQLALSLAGGQPFLGFDIGGGGYRVLNLQAEVAERRMQQRFAQQVRSFPDDAPAGVLTASVFSSVKLDEDEGAGQVLGWVDEHHPNLVIVDPLANFHGGDENQAKDMARVISVLDAIRQKGTAVAVIHHHGKTSANQQNVGYKARGSSVLSGWYDSHLSLEWADPNRTVRLRFELRHGEAPDAMVIRLNPATLLFEAQEDETKQIGLVLAAIGALGPSDAQVVANHYGLTRQWASEWLNRAVADGKLQRNGTRRILFSIPGQEPTTNVSVTPEAVVVSTNTAEPLRIEVDGREVNYN
jgi:hypothetical protein